MQRIYTMPEPAFSCFKLMEDLFLWIATNRHREFKMKIAHPTPMPGEVILIEDEKVEVEP